MEQNKVRTYVLYAIGEIFLVVIGILIALQVNNWNEEKKQYQATADLLVAIQDDILEDIKLLDEGLVNHLNRFKSLNKILSDSMEVEDYSGNAGVELFRYSETYYPITLNKDNYQYYINQVDKQSDKYKPVTQLLNELYNQHGKLLEYYRDLYLDHLLEYKRYKRTQSWYSEYERNGLPQAMKEFFANDQMNKNYLTDSREWVINIYLNMQRYKATGFSAYIMIHDLLGNEDLPAIIADYEAVLTKEQKADFVGIYVPVKDKNDASNSFLNLNHIYFELNDAGMLQFRYNTESYSELDEQELKARSTSHLFGLIGDFYFTNDSLRFEPFLFEPQYFVKEKED